MVGASKILTVSYGTFSCTLEGFEEPFSTMKAIAEYFRDLAADDRYFGAEPPVPDAEMLHRIAEREVQRRVEAKVQENGVVLRAGDLPAPAPQQPAPFMSAAAAAPTVAPVVESVAARLQRLRAAAEEARAARAAEAPAQSAPAQSAPAPVAPEFASFEEEEPEPEDSFPAAPQPAFVPFFAESPETAEVAETDDAAETVAEEDQADPLTDQADPLTDPADTPVEAAKADTRAEAPQEVADEDTASEAAPVEVAAETAAASDFEDEDADATEDRLLEDTISSVMAAFSESPALAATGALTTPEEVAPEADDAPAGSTEAAPVAERSAEPLVRPRARVIKVRRMEAEAGTRPRFETYEDEPADTATESAAETSASVAEAPVEDAVEDAAFLTPEETEAAEAAQAETTPTGAAEADAALLSETAEETADLVAEAAAEAEATHEIASSLSDEDEASLMAELAEIETEVAGGAPEADTLADDEDDIEAEALAEAPAEATEAEEAEPEERAEVETAAAEEDAAYDGTSDDRDEAAAPLRLETAPAAETAETADAQNAAPEAETDDRATEEAAPDAPAHHPGRGNLLRSTPASGDADMTRLMQQADSELTEPENRRRLSTIAHLKAAVAATEADKELAKDDSRSEGPSELDRYRDDLAHVVRPNRPVARHTTARPAPQPDRPAPLVLVSEQRIDRPAGPSEGLVIRPRRVMSGNLAIDHGVEEQDQPDETDENIFADSRSFADFAERIGATELPDLLEAAAAYAACVEGRPSFSRPQIMRSAASAAEGEVTREASLRSFGMLLRQGKIQKIRRGQFAIAETSRYLSEARKIAR